MKPSANIPRREFIRLSALSGACLAVGLTSADGREVSIVNIAREGGDLGTEVNSYIFIDQASSITVFNHRPEMGQGTYQAIPMIIAEELDADIENVIITQSPANRAKYGDQMVVGSRSIQNNYELMRKVGASAREMLVQAAANRWKVSPQDCGTENARVINKKTGEKLVYGELVKDASLLSAPQNPSLKNPKDFKIIGKSLPRRDTPLKVSGEAKFGMDFIVPGMLYASVERSPVFLGKIVGYADAKAKAVPGVKYVLKTKREVWGHSREGVAVIADNYWAAELGRKVLDVKWDNGDLESWSTAKIKDDYKKASAEPGEVFVTKGDFINAFDRGLARVEATYETPYQTHAPMEPMNATVSVEKDRCEFWGSTQNPNGVKSYLAQQLGIAEDKVFINYTFMGGGFGRRSMTDVAEEAADLSKQTGAPIKVIWSREDDLTQGPFRACSLNVCKGAVDDQGNVTALEHKVICQDIRNQTGDDPKASRAIMGGVNTEYSIPNLKVTGVLRKFYIPVTYWRGVYHSTNCFAHESFIDELANAARKDPLDFRLGLLKNHRRYTQVLERVAEISGWRGPRGKDTGKGVAIVERSGAFVAMVVEIARVGGKVKPIRITAAIDCGTVVNPDIVKAQTEGAAIMGLTATYKSGLTIEKGKVVEKNFDTYKMLTIAECPEIEIAVIVSNDPPEGAGEAGLPTVAPALANAIFDLTKKRLRVVPIDLNGV